MLGTTSFFVFFGTRLNLVSLAMLIVKRGHSSINVLVTLISKENEKHIDSYVMSNKCEGFCSTWANEKNSPGYQEWLANHVYQANHSGSPGSIGTNRYC